MNEYNPKDIEPKWQQEWEEKQYYAAHDNSDKPKWYTLVEFPFPSGAGLHVGHVRSYTALDIVSRKKRMQGFNVLYPIGWDAFGLPTENFAIKHKIHPSEATAQNVTTFKRQLQAMGLSFDWNREVNTTDPSYYKWTQWIFLQFFKEGLAYQQEMPINWCPSCKTGLANEEVIDGKCERCGTETTKKMVKQWMLAITKYAQRLIDDLETVDYLPKIAAQQINWIGKSTGAKIRFAVKGSESEIEVFTTRPDTLFGATYMVLSPEHELVNSITADGYHDAVHAYQKQAASKSDLERTDLAKEKSGAFTGAYAINPATGEEIPVWIADYVLATYGTGAIMAVPAHDQRDWEFAKQYDLPIQQVVSGEDVNLEEAAYTGDGEAVNSDFLDGKTVEDAKAHIIAWLEEQGKGEADVNYKLRDWIFSRQHYWGEPIPIIHCEECGTVPVPEDQLPLELPDVENYEPTDTGESPLAAIRDWVEVECPSCGAKAERETDTMPNWAGSSWYFLRYIDANNSEEFASQDKLKYWLEVDLYNGGMEHTTLHLLYSRFWHKFLYDIGQVPTAEPYQRRRSHGMVLAHDGKKMSKSKGNVENPDDIIDEYGADTLRLYEMFMGPFDEAIAWDDKALKGVRKFLERVWRLQEKLVDSAENEDIERTVHQTVKKVTEDIDAMKFNTAVSQLMICVNEMEAVQEISKADFSLFLRVLSVFTPHISEEIWANIGNGTSITQEQWPQWDEAKLVQSVVTIAVQVNGKVRSQVDIAPDASEEDAKAAALADEKIQEHLKEGELRKFIYVPGRIINLVVS